MTTTMIIGEVLSILAMSIAILSFQFKNRIQIIIMQTIANTIFAFSYIMLSKPFGAMVTAIAICRNFTYMLKDKYRWIESIYVVIVYTILSIVCYFLSFYVFKLYEKTVKNFIIECLPILGALAATLSYRMKDGNGVRKVMLFSCPVYLVYNIFCLSIGGILNESISMVSIIIGLIRHKRNNNINQKN